MYQRSKKFRFLVDRILKRKICDRLYHYFKFFIDQHILEICLSLVQHV